MRQRCLDQDFPGLKLNIETLDCFAKVDFLFSRDELLQKIVIITKKAISLNSLPILQYQVELLLTFLLFGRVEALPRNARNLKRTMKLLWVDILQPADILVVERSRHCLSQSVVKIEPADEEPSSLPGQLKG